MNPPLPWLPREPIALSTVFVLGLCLGSFLNVVIHRLPRGESLAHPRSRCPRCRHGIRPWHNIPVLGWLLLRGRCADCGLPISPRYPLVELAGGALLLVAATVFPTPVHSLAAAWFFLSLTAVLFIDLEHRIIPDEISLGGTALGLLLAHWTVGLVPAVIGALAGAGGLFLVSLVYRGLRHRDGMGMGDVKLAAMLGAFLGLPGVVLTVLLASLFGSILGVTLMMARRGSGTTALPFGSLLAPAAAFALLWGPRIWAWYAGFFPRR
jgi:leader peptidase (prepilin peptidase) / N-methyltransferase